MGLKFIIFEDIQVLEEFQVIFNSEEFKVSSQLPALLDLHEKK